MKKLVSMEILTPKRYRIIALRSDLREEDNLSIVDKMAGPNVSFIRRFHCT